MQWGKASVLRGAIALGTDANESREMGNHMNAFSDVNSLSLMRRIPKVLYIKSAGMQQ